MYLGGCGLGIQRFTCVCFVRVNVTVGVELGKCVIYMLWMRVLVLVWTLGSAVDLVVSWIMDLAIP